MSALTLSYRVMKFNRTSNLVEQDIDYARIGVPVVCPDVTVGEFEAELDEAFLGTRDDRLLDALSKLYDERGGEDIEVAVVYGAAHVPAVVRGLMARHGFRPRSGDWLTIIDA